MGIHLISGSLHQTCWQGDSMYEMNGHEWTDSCSVLYREITATKAHKQGEATLYVKFVQPGSFAKNVGSKKGVIFK